MSTARPMTGRTASKGRSFAAAPGSMMSREQFENAGIKGPSGPCGTPG